MTILNSNKNEYQQLIHLNSYKIIPESIENEMDRPTSFLYENFFDKS